MEIDFSWVSAERISRLRFGFLQDIYRLPDHKPILTAKVIGTALNEKGHPRIPAEVEELLANSGQKYWFYSQGEAPTVRIYAIYMLRLWVLRPYRKVLFKAEAPDGDQEENYPHEP